MMFCKECGFEMNENSKFCSNCGARIEQSGMAKEQTPDESVAEVKESSAVTGEPVSEASASIADLQDAQVNAAEDPATQDDLNKADETDKAQGHPESGKKKWIIIGGGAVLALLVTGLVLFFAFFSNSFSGDYRLVSITASDGTDVLGDIIYKGDAIPTSLQIDRSGKGSITADNNEVFAELQFKKNKGEISYTKTKENCAVEIYSEDDLLTIRETETKKTYTFVKAKSVVLSDLAGDYLLTGASTPKSTNWMKYLANNNLKLPNQLTMKADGTGSIRYSEGGDSYAELTIGAEDMIGTIAYTSNAEVNDTYVVYGNDTLTVYDTGYKRACVYTRQSTVDLSVAQGEYVLTHTSSKKYSDRIEYWTDNNKKVPDQLTMKADGTGSIRYSEGGDSYAELSISAEDMTGKITYTKSGVEKDIYVVVGSDALTVYDTGYNCMFVYTRQSTIDLSAAQGEYLLTHTSSKKYSDRIEYWTDNKKKIPDQLTMKADGTGSIRYTDGDSYADLSIGAENMTGTITYTKSDEVKDIYVVVGSDTLTVYDTGYNCMFVYTRQSTIDLSAAEGKYVLTRASTQEHSDLIEYWTDNNNWISNRLSMNADGTGSIFFTDGSSYAELALAAEDMTGTISYTRSFSEKDIYVVVGSDTLSVYDTGNNRSFVFTRQSAIDLSAAQGEYVLTHLSSQQHSDELEYITNSGFVIPDQLTVKSDGTGSIRNSEGGDSFAELSISPEDMTGKITYTKSGKELDIYVVVGSDTLTIYDRGPNRTFVYTRQSAIDLSAAEGEYVLTHASKKDSGDRMEYWTNNNNMIPDQLTMKADGTGSIRYSKDGDSYAELSIGAENMIGTITYTNSSNEKDIYVVVGSDTLTVYDTGYNSMFVYTRQSAIDLSAAQGEYELTKNSTKDHDDYIKYLTDNSYEIPQKLSMKNDGTGSIRYTDGSAYADLTFSAVDLNGTIKYIKADKEYMIYVAIGDDTLTIYDSGTDQTYVYAKAE